MANHVMFRADNLAGTTQGKYLASVRISADIDNGMVVALGAYETGSREVRAYATPAANTPIGKLAILGSEEVDKEKTFDTVGGFTNKAGTIGRAYIFEHGDYFAVTAGAFDTAPAVGDVIEAQAATAMKVVDTATTGSTVIGECVAIEADGATTWYVVHVA